MYSRIVKRGVIVGVAVVVASSSIASAAPPEPSGPPAQNVVVANGPDKPVPVSAAQSGAWNVGLTGTPTVNVGNFPQAAVAPLWQGTPYASSQVLIRVSSFQCADLTPVPSGQVLFVRNVVTDFNVPPGNAGSANLRFTPLGGTQQFLALPVQRSAPATQVAGLYDRYQGALELGMPATGGLSACFTGGPDLNGTIAVFGFLIPAP